MKKIRLVLAALTAVSAIYMIYANWSVRGYNLLTMNSEAGHRVAVTYILIQRTIRRSEELN